MNSEFTADQSISRMFTVARVIAILTVISAHITIRTSDLVANFYSAIGSIGVVVFMIASGYYYKHTDFLTLVKKKTISIVIPWIVIGSAVWLVDTLLNGRGFSIQSLFLWLVGYKTYLYYVVVLLICFVLFYVHNKVSLYIAMAINAVSIILTVFGVTDTFIETLHITNYLNVANWIGFFALGMLLQKMDHAKLYQFIVYTRWLWFAISSIATLIITVTGYKVGYFSPLGWLYELVSALSILGICTYSFTYNKFTVSISEMSYAIYLLHLMFTGVLAKIYGMHVSLSLFANIFVLAVTYFILFLGKVVAEKIKLGKVYALCIGLRRVNPRKT